MVCGAVVIGIVMSWDATPSDVSGVPAMDPEAVEVSRLPGMSIENIGKPNRVAVSSAFSCMPLMSGVAAR